jgi:hypothetical protein
MDSSSKRLMMTGSIKHHQNIIISKWSNQLAVSLLAEIFGYLTSTERLIIIERTCRYWNHQSHNGIGWYYLNAHEWLLPGDQRRDGPSPYYPWSLLKQLLNNRCSSLSKNNTNINGMGTLANGIRSIRARAIPISLAEWIDILIHLPRLQHANAFIKSSNDSIVRMQLTQMTTFLSSSKLITLELTLRFPSSEPKWDVIIPCIPSLIDLIIIYRDGVIGLSSMPHLSRLNLVGRWKPIDRRGQSYDNTLESSNGDKWLLPSLIDLRLCDMSLGQDRALSFQFLLTASRHSLQSLNWMDHVGGMTIDEMKVLFTIDIPSLTSLHIRLLSPAPGDISLSGLSQLRHLHVPICTEAQVNQITTQWLPSLKCLQSITYSSFLYFPVRTPTLCNVLSSLSSLQCINGVPRDAWLATKQGGIGPFS